MPTSPITVTGIEPAIQAKNEIDSPRGRAERAMAFWGLAIGVVIPPRLHDMEIPRRAALLKEELAGRSRSVGRITAVERRAAATLEIHMERNQLRIIMARSTHFGSVPAIARTYLASLLLNLYFPRAAAIVKPPKKSMILGSKNLPVINGAASGAGRGLQVAGSLISAQFSGSSKMLNHTTGIGIRILVTKSGTASVAQRTETSTRRTKQLCSALRVSKTGIK
mmetsp:Transcript_42798/g.108030  ORF Transcript_42798/g.108030 Transcript_42798/m.108030 type:complete len:223 (+) Transcript_42798:836-1504(+)